MASTPMADRQQREMVVKWADQVKTWTNLNRGWEYQFLGDEACTDYVNEKFFDQPTVHSFWNQLNFTILRADFIRYLAILADGGVYSDMDTRFLKQYEEKDIRVVAGTEYGDNSYPMFARPVSLCQWTLMAKPGHPVFQKVVARVIYSLGYLARIKHFELGQLRLDKKEVLDATGPCAFTGSVMEIVSEHQGRRVE